MYANATPWDFTLPQSVVRCQLETSIPCGPDKRFASGLAIPVAAAVRTEYQMPASSPGRMPFGSVLAQVLSFVE